MPPRSDEESHRLTPAVNTHSAPSTLHAGSQLIALLRHEFWILRAAPPFDPFFIRSLSAYHVRAFVHTSIDYAGPIAARTSPGQEHRIRLISLYSYASILRARQRLYFSYLYRVSTICFSPRTIDADRELSNAHAKTIRDPNFQNRLAIDGTAWHFLLPASPHFGDL